jgi:ABC-type multidrug transport system ATPase subunit
LRNVLWNVPVYLSAYLDAMVAAKRIRIFLEAPEVGPVTYSSSAVLASASSNVDVQETVRVDDHQKSCFQRINLDPSLPIGAIVVSSGHFSWSQNAPTVPVVSAPDSGYFALSDINLKCAPGSLTAVVGSVGSGKSSLVLAILGEMPGVGSGIERSASLNGRVAYVPQSAFILNATCKENILFGAPFDAERYAAVIKASELASDFLELVHGENTMIGDKGMTISGGQKQRISIARALYSQADIVIFDDPLSAVDAHVGNKLFFEAVNGALLRGRTKLFVTNQTQYLPFCDHVVYLKNGVVAASGSPDQVTAVLMDDDPSKHPAACATDSQADDDESTQLPLSATSDMTEAQAVSEEKTGQSSSTALVSPVSAKIEHAAIAAVVVEKPVARRPGGGGGGTYNICDMFLLILRGPWFLTAALLLNFCIFGSLMGHQFVLALYALHSIVEFSPFSCFSIV